MSDNAMLKGIMHDSDVPVSRCMKQKATRARSMFAYALSKPTSYLHPLFASMAHHPVVPSQPPPQSHIQPRCSGQSPTQPPHLPNLPMQSRNLPQRCGELRLTLTALRQRHIRPTQPLTQNIHNLRRHIFHILILQIKIRQHSRQPFKALLHMSLKRGGNSDGDGEAHEWRDLFEEAGVDAHENCVEEVGLAGGLEPL